MSLTPTLRHPPLSFTVTATPELSTLSLHDALPILVGGGVIGVEYTCMFAVLGVRVTLIEKRPRLLDERDAHAQNGEQDRKSTRLNSSHQIISYAVFCLKKKNETSTTDASCNYYSSM